MNEEELISLAEKVPYMYWWNIEALIEKAESESVKEKLKWIMRRKELYEQENV